MNPIARLWLPIGESRAATVSQRFTDIGSRRLECLLRSADVEPDGGHDDGNVTAYHPQQREWFYLGPHNWHHPTMDKWLYRFQRGDLPFRQEPVGVLRWRGQVVLNRQDM